MAEKTAIINTYAPHGGHEYRQRQRHYSDLAKVIDETSCFGLKLVVGDFNARIHNSIGGEQSVFGQNCFGNPLYNPQQNSDKNRELLLELCVGRGLCVANTFMDNDAEQQATFHDIWQNPVSEISHRGFAQLDLVICPRSELWQVKQIRSDRWQALASHHFLVEVVAELNGGPADHRDSGAIAKHPRYDFQAFQDASIRNKFAQRSHELVQESLNDSSGAEQVVSVFCEALHSAAAEMLPVSAAQAKKPWIQAGTLDLITSRNDARKDGDRTRELFLNKRIRKSAVCDRTLWLQNMITTGSWEEIKKLKKSRSLHITGRRLNDRQGQLVQSDLRADTFATHLEEVQWAVRPMNAVENIPPLGPLLPTCAGTITADELKCAVGKLKTKRAAIQMPAELLKTLLYADAITDDCWLLKLMQMCWDTKTTPTAWHISQVIPVYKKGNPAHCDNYRPISLVSVLYKVYATILLNRLKAGGAEARLWSRQFGFRSRRSTEDALFIVRRRIEQALAARGGAASLLALDWRKAFDSIAPERLLCALRRFGVNASMLEAIREIYSERSFVVIDESRESAMRPQRAGISQGCPLSPFLFGMVMTILMTDATNMLSQDATNAFRNGDLEDILFADDTLLIGRRGKHVEEYMAAVEKRGLDYGLQVHWGKVHFVPVNTTDSIRAPSGDLIAPQESMLYLGATIHADGKFGCEVSRKLGAAGAEFKSLQTVWNNSSLPMSRKLFIFEALISNKLRYGVASAWLAKADLRRIDGFQANCLRKMLRIPVSFVSRITNERVRTIAQQPPLSQSIKASQLALYDQVLNNPEKHYLRSVAFHRDSLLPKTAAFVRRVGRPRDNWTEQVQNMSRGY